jgi:hypothetical protein
MEQACDVSIELRDSIRQESLKRCSPEGLLQAGAIQEVARGCQVPTFTVGKIWIQRLMPASLRTDLHTVIPSSDNDGSSEPLQLQTTLDMDTDSPVGENCHEPSEKDAGDHHRELFLQPDEYEKFQRDPHSYLGLNSNADLNVEVCFHPTSELPVAEPHHPAQDTLLSARTASARQSDVKLIAEPFADAVASSVAALDMNSSGSESRSGLEDVDLVVDSGALVNTNRTQHYETAESKAAILRALLKLCSGEGALKHGAQTVVSKQLNVHLCCVARLWRRSLVSVAATGTVILRKRKDERQKENTTVMQHSNSGVLSAEELNQLKKCAAFAARKKARSNPTSSSIDKSLDFDDSIGTADSSAIARPCLMDTTPKDGSNQATSDTLDIEDSTATGDTSAIAQPTLMGTTPEVGSSQENDGIATLVESSERRSPTGEPNDTNPSNTSQAPRPDPVPKRKQMSPAASIPEDSCEESSFNAVKVTNSETAQRPTDQQQRVPTNIPDTTLQEFHPPLTGLSDARSANPILPELLSSLNDVMKFLSRKYVDDYRCNEDLFRADVHVSMMVNHLVFLVGIGGSIQVQSSSASDSGRPVHLTLCGNYNLDDKHCLLFNISPAVDNTQSCALCQNCQAVASVNRAERGVVKKEEDDGLPDAVKKEEDDVLPDAVKSEYNEILPDVVKSTWSSPQLRKRKRTVTPGGKNAHVRDRKAPKHHTSTHLARLPRDETSINGGDEALPLNIPNTRTKVASRASRALTPSSPQRSRGRSLCTQTTESTKYGPKPHFCTSPILAPPRFPSVGFALEPSSRKPLTADIKALRSPLRLPTPCQAEPPCDIESPSRGTSQPSVDAFPLEDSQHESGTPPSDVRYPGVLIQPRRLERYTQRHVHDSQQSVQDVIPTCRPRAWRYDPVDLSPSEENPEHRDYAGRLDELEDDQIERRHQHDQHASQPEPWPVAYTHPHPPHVGYHAMPFHHYPPMMYAAPHAGVAPFTGYHHPAHYHYRPRAAAHNATAPRIHNQLRRW